MLFYRVSDDRQFIRYFGTLDDAHKEAKALDKDLVVSIEQVEVPPDKAHVLRLVTSEGGTELPSSRFWTLTPRGGLREITREQFENL